MIKKILTYFILPLLILSLLFVWLIDLMRLRDIPKFSRSDFMMMQDAYEKFVYDAIMSHPDCYRGGGCSDELGSGPNGCRTHWACDDLNKSMKKLAINNLFVSKNGVSFYADDMYGNESDVQYNYIYDEQQYQSIRTYSGNILLTGDWYYKIIDHDIIPMITTGYIIDNINKYAMIAKTYIDQIHLCKTGCKSIRDEYHDTINKIFLSGILINDHDYLLFDVMGTGGNGKSWLVLKYVTNHTSRDERVQRAEKIINPKEYLTSLNGRRELPDEIILDQIVRFFVLVPKITFIASFLR